MYKTYMSEEKRQEHNNNYAHTLSLQFCQLARDSASNILGQCGNFASIENEKEVIRFLEVLKQDFVSDLDTTISNLEITYFGEKEGTKHD